jgi:tetratricopeptide (TPR) repeat protein
VGTPRAVASPDRGDDARHTSWPARALLSVLLVAVAVVLVGAFEVGPAAALFVREAPARRDLIVVTDFTAPNGDTSLALVVSYAVRDGLAQSRALEVMSPSRVASTLELMERERDARVDLATAREVALREGGSAVVDGEVTQVASGYVVTARLVTADSERVLTSFKRGGDGPEGLMQIVDDLVESLRRQSGESLREVQAGVPLRRARTSSLEAARLFTEGIHASDVKVDWPLAVEKLRDAVAIDSSFAMAWLALGVMYENLGAPRSQVEDATLRAYALRDRLPSLERTAVEAAYFARGPGRDRVRAIAALRRLPHLWNNVALQYQRRREYARAESTWRAGLARDSSSRLVLRNLALNLRLQGKLGEADSVEAVLERRFGADPSVPFHRSLGAYLRGDVEPTDRAFREVARQPRASPPVLTMRAHLALLRGERVHWRAALARRRAGESGRRGGGIPIAELAAEAALESQVFGEATEALDDVERRLARDSIARLPEVDRPYIPVAAAFAWAGRPARARALLEEYARTVRDTGLLRAQRPELQSAEGAIALAEGRHREAIALFRQGDSLPDGPAHLFAARLPLQLGLTFDAANEPDSAIAWFERYLALPVMGRLEPSLDPASLARVHERLGALYEARGDSARAVASYRTFVRLWAAADPILQPRVAAARTRMDRLAAGLAATRAPDASPPTRVPLRVQPRP